MTQSETRTPRTDAHDLYLRSKHGSVFNRITYYDMYDFARQLELELELNTFSDLKPFAHLFRMDGVCIKHEMYRCERCQNE